MPGSKVISRFSIRVLPRAFCGSSHSESASTEAKRSSEVSWYTRSTTESGLPDASGLS
ncbi:hypothetical protein D3C78_1578280 [compost metagenome]